MPGSEGMTHIQMQTAWTQGKAALVADGSWVENEAAPTMPKDFDLAVGSLIGTGTGDKLPFGTLYAAAGEPYIVAKDGKNPTGGMELLRIMLSKKQTDNFTNTTKSLTCVTGAADGLSLTPGLASASVALKAAGPNVLNSRLQDWYVKLNQETIGNLTAQLVTGQADRREVDRGRPEGGRRHEERLVRAEVQARLTNPPRRLRRERPATCDTASTGSSSASWQLPWRCTRSS